MLGVFSAMEVAASGLSAERTRMNTIASNLANARTTRTEAGGPYKRLDPVFKAVWLDDSEGLMATQGGVSKVKVAQKIQEDTRQGMMVYEPGHPDANAQGYVEYPNVNAVEEMVNMITASRAYEAGVTTIDTVKAMGRSALDIGKYRPYVADRRRPVFRTPRAARAGQTASRRLPSRPRMLRADPADGFADVRGSY